MAGRPAYPTPWIAALAALLVGCGSHDAPAPAVGLQARLAHLPLVRRLRCAASPHPQLREHRQAWRLRYSVLGDDAAASAVLLELAVDGNLTLVSAGQVQSRVAPPALASQLAPKRFGAGEDIVEFVSEPVRHSRSFLRFLRGAPANPGHGAVAAFPRRVSSPPHRTTTFLCGFLAVAKTKSRMFHVCGPIRIWVY